MKTLSRTLASIALTAASLACTPCAHAGLGDYIFSVETGLYTGGLASAAGADEHQARQQRYAAPPRALTPEEVESQKAEGKIVLRVFWGVALACMLALGLFFAHPWIGASLARLRAR